MAGRGLGMTKPAWMTQAQGGAGPLAGPPAGIVLGASAVHAQPQRYADTSSNGHSHSPTQNPHAGMYGKRDDHPHKRSGSRSRSPTRDRDQKRRSRFDRSRSRERQAGHESSADGYSNRAHDIQRAPVASGLAPAPVPYMAHTLSQYVDIKAMLSSALASVAAGGGAAGGGAGLAASRPYRRLYVGSIPTSTELEVQSFFNAVLARAYMPGEHCIGVSVGGSDKRFAFLEFRTVDIATAALQLDGVVFKGQSLKLRRPHDYSPLGQPPPSGPPITLRLNDFGIVSSNVPDGPNKVFVGGLPHTLTEEQLRELLAAFGPLRGLHMVKEAGAVNNKGYAFAEYVDPAATDIACQSLNGLTLGEKALTVRRATSQQGGAGQLGRNVIPGTIGAMGMGAGMGPGLNPAAMGMSMGAPGGMVGTVYGGAYPTNIGMPSHSPSRPVTRLVRLQSMINGDDLALSAPDWNELIADIRGELSLHGALLSLHVPRAGPYAGNVYVMYAERASAELAARAVAGKTFDGRLIPVEYEDEEKMGEILRLG